MDVDATAGVAGGAASRARHGRRERTTISIHLNNSALSRTSADDGSLTHAMGSPLVPSALPPPRERSASPTRRASRRGTHKRDGRPAEGGRVRRGQGGPLPSPRSQRVPSTCWCWPRRRRCWRRGACAGCARGAWPNARGEAWKPKTPKTENPRCPRGTPGVSQKESGSDLLSRAVSREVPSALEGLTSVFGMGTGGTPPT